MAKNPLAIIILAAGKGMRMKSAKPKVLHEIGGLPMIKHVARTAEQLKPAKIVVVVGPGMEDVAAAVQPHATVIQKSQKGTGDAVKAALAALKNFKNGDALVLYGDAPLIRVEDLKALIAARGKNAGVSVAVMRPEIPGAYGRVVLNKDGSLKKIVEAKDATAAELEIDLCNAGFLCADAKSISRWLGAIKNANAQGEFYLTDLPGIAAKDGAKTMTAMVDEDNARGVNDRYDLAIAEQVFQDRMRFDMLRAGVTLQDPNTVYFSHDTKIASDVTVEPNVIFGSGVSIASGCVIKSFSHLEGAFIGKNVTIGPFARLRPGATIEEGAKIGNFVEIKKSKIGARSKINHLAYVGDTNMGKDVNFSAGAITVNFDGFDKYQTIIGDGVMIGSNVNLIAPVTIHEGAFVAAGSTVAENAPKNSLFIGRERPKIREGWAAEFRKRKKSKKPRKKLK